MEKTIFEKIAEGSIDAQIIWQDEKFLAFLDIRPLAEGHTLVVPKRCIGDYIFALEDVDLSELMLASKKVAALLDSKLDCDRCLVWVQGFEVPHVHVHLIPAKKGTLMQDLKAREVSSEDLIALRQRIVV